MKASLNNIVTSIDIKKLQNCDLIIEAVKEDYNVKSNIFKHDIKKKFPFHFFLNIYQKFYIHTEITQHNIE